MKLVRGRFAFAGALCAVLSVCALAAGSAHAAVLYNQDNQLAQEWIGSQDENMNGEWDPRDPNGFNRQASEFQAADDFEVTDSAGWKISEVWVRGRYSDFYNRPGGGPAFAFHVYFYRDRGGTPSGAAPIHSRKWSLYDQVGDTFRISYGEPPTLPAGKYWVSVVAAQPVEQNAYWSWQTREIEAGAGAKVFAEFLASSPNINCQPAAWYPIRNCNRPLTSGPDLAFSLHGTPRDRLSFQKTGEGRGTVTSTGGDPSSDLNCPPNECTGRAQSIRYDRGSRVTFTASPEMTSGSESIFAGWEGCDEPQGSRCVMVMNTPNRAKSLRARFNPRSSLAVYKYGAEGTVRSSDGRFECGIGECNDGRIMDYSRGAQVTLAARGLDRGSSSPASVFVGWEGCDRPSGSTCVMDLSTRFKTVYARFVRASYITVRKRGAGDGRVRSEPAGVLCPVGRCKPRGQSFKFAGARRVTLFAAPSPDTPRSSFVGWTGCERPNGTQCVMSADPARAKTVVANFARR